MLCAALCLTITSTTSASPDVVLVVVDDLGWADAGCMPDGRHSTPAIDALQTRGALFTHASANGPNCAPARASLLTGRWTPRHGIHTVGSGRRGKAEHRLMEPPPNRTALRPGMGTIASHLGEAGWRTAHVGKWHLGDDPTKHGFDVNIGGTSRGSPRSHFSPYLNPALEDGPDRELLSSRLVDEAIALMESDDDRPLFLHLSFYDVHTPLQADPDALRETRRAHPDWSKRQAVYDCMVRRTDAQIGRLLRHVDEDAIVMLCSDHGGVGRLAHNGMLRGCKGQLYEGGVRTPLIVTGPTIAPGSLHDTPVSLHDLAPTVLDLCGLPEDSSHDGRSLVDVLEGRSVGGSSPAQYWHFPCYLEAGGAVSGRWRTTPVSAIRVGDWKLLHFLEDDRTELYDLHDDPGERVNLAESRPRIHTSMVQLLDAWRHRTDAPMPEMKHPS